MAISTLLASFMLVSVAEAETVVPPGNGAATQYTEAFPTSGGNAVPGDGIKGGGGSHSTPSHVLGHRNAKRLEGAGQVGKEVAEVAAETAPANLSAASKPAGPAARATGGVSGGDGSAQAGSGGGGSGSGGAHRPAQGNPSQGSAQADEGSSGLSEAIGQATGSSSGESGLLLPLILLTAVLGSIAYVWRRRVVH